MGLLGHDHLPGLTALLRFKYKCQFLRLLYYPRSVNQDPFLISLISLLIRCLIVFWCKKTFFEASSKHYPGISFKTIGEKYYSQLIARTVFKIQSLLMVQILKMCFDLTDTVCFDWSTWEAVWFSWKRVRDSTWTSMDTLPSLTELTSLCNRTRYPRFWSYGPYLLQVWPQQR